jgi:hypothetical protein
VEGLLGKTAGIMKLRVTGDYRGIPLMPRIIKPTCCATRHWAKRKIWEEYSK